jgi:pyridoxamine 5'-phosphate oxidase
MPTRLQQLDEIEQCIWSELESCVAPRVARHDHDESAEPSEIGAHPRAPDRHQHEWRVAVLATVDNGQADARSVVLREVDASERRLVFYTDARSPKVRQIEASPHGTLMFWSRERGWQLRMQVRLAVETSGLAVSSRWARLKTTAGARDYQSAAAPGSVLDAPLADLDDRTHFAMIEAMADSVDWLEIDPAGHRRALFRDDGATWIQA